MSSETTAPPQAQQLASIFQKAYARAVALQRMDEQIGALLEQRQRLENEFREAQGEVNAECERMLQSASIAPAKILAQLAESSSGAAATSASMAADAVPTGPELTVSVNAGSNGRFGRGSRQTVRS
jgi:Tfp pilus assembly protein PilE